MSKTKSIRVRLTDEEWLEAEAASLSLFGNNNKSKLIRKLLRDYIGFGPDLSEKEMTAFRESVRQLTGIARNLNQLTSRINADDKQISHITADYLERVKLHVTEVNDRLKGYIENTVNRYQEFVNNDQ